MNLRSPFRSAGAFVALLLLPWTGFASAQEPVPPLHLPAHRPAVPAVHGLVTGGHPLASMAGIRILLAGGNAVDATVAVGAVLNVVKPASSGAGGNGFFTIYDRETDRVYSMNATGAAPLALRPETMGPDDLLRGIRAGIIPGTVGGWIAMLDRFGTMTLGQVLEPAIAYAEGGHPIDPSVARGIAQQEELFRAWPTSARTFLPEGRAPSPGDRVRMPELAATFRKLAAAEAAALAEGSSRSEALQAAWDRFYRGDIAQEIVRFHGENGGLITLEDLDRHGPLWPEPLHTRFRGYDVYSSPSTSRGGYEVLMQLNLLEGFDLKGMGHNSPEALHLIVEAIKLAKADIYHFVADPAFTEIPTAGMLAPGYAEERRRLIDPARAMAYPGHGEVPRTTVDAAAAASPSGPPLDPRTQDGSTDSYSVADPFGNVVGATPTHGSGFGTGVVVGSTGLTFNNGMRVGSASPYPDNVNYPRGGQIPILNNAPILVFRDGEFILSLGTPGGEAIGQNQFQVLLNVLEFGLGIQEAIEAPRLSLSGDPNFYLPGADITVHAEGRIPASAVQGLRTRGHGVELVAGFAGGNMQGILRDPATGAMTAGGDPRNLGYAVGW